MQTVCHCVRQSDCRMMWLTCTRMICFQQIIANHCIMTFDDWRQIASEEHVPNINMQQLSALLMPCEWWQLMVLTPTKLPCCHLFQLVPGSTLAVFFCLAFLSWPQQHQSQLLTISYSLLFIRYKGIARTQSPTIKNYALDLPTFGVIAGVNPTEVQWKGLALGDRPRWSPIPPRQVSMF